jgi:hypothetical protein
MEEEAEEAREEKEGAAEKEVQIVFCRESRALFFFVG